MVTLGISGGLNAADEYRSLVPNGSHHDSAAVVVVDGQVVAAVEEERISRAKHTNRAPISAIRACLKLAGVEASQIDTVAVGTSEECLNRAMADRAIADEGFGIVAGRAYLRRLLSQRTGVDLPSRKFCFVDHHVAHASSAFYCSPFQEALVVSLDGVGNDRSGAVYNGSETALHEFQSLGPEKSLGHFYLRGIEHLGYRLFDEYKVMGLAPYGNPDVYRELFQSFYTLLPDGDVELHMDRFAALAPLCPAGAPGSAFLPASRNVAAALQEALELIAFHVIRHAKQVSGHRHLCLAGGVALNCTLNGKLLRSGLFDDIFVQPAAHDGGLALGAALASEIKLTRRRPSPLRNVYLGRPCADAADVESRLNAWSGFVRVARLPSPAQSAAELIAEGQVIGWVQGRAEYGPRALGNRSILADPRPPRNKDVINSMVKKREAYRPFAPAVLEEAAADWFEVTPVRTVRSPFMLFAHPVAGPLRAKLGAVTHVDGTARLQTVSRDDNPLFWEVISHFGKLTGVPLLLNTSFNDNNEPIVDSVDDAVTTYLTTSLDALIVDTFLIDRLQVPQERYYSLIPSIPDAVRLFGDPTILAGSDADGLTFELCSLADGRRCEISRKAMRLLLDVDGHASLGELITQVQCGSHAEIVTAEILRLWASRFVKLSPPGRTDS